MRFTTGLLALVWLIAGAALEAQTPPPPDTSDVTARFLEAQEDTRRLTAPVARPGSEGLLPSLSRVVMTRDSIEWSNVSTVGDLLQQVPGVYLLKGGWIGQVSVPAFRGQGARSVEYYLDGVEYLPLGADSTMVDPSLLPLSFYDRIEVERLPGLLRVYLFTRRHDRLAPRTRIAITTGDLDISRYQGSLEHRSRSGFGYALAFDFLGVASLRRPNENDYQNANAWLQASYVSGPRRGVVVQYSLGEPRRLAILTAAGDTLSRGLDESRRDLQARAYLRERTDGLGASLDLIAIRSTWAAESGVDTIPDAERRVTRVGVLAGYRTPVAHLSATGWRRSDWTRSEVTASAAVSPRELLTASIELGRRGHDFDRTSTWVMARAGVLLPLGFSANGTWRHGSLVEFPMIETDSAREVREASATLAWTTAPLSLEAGYARTRAPTLSGYWAFPHLGMVGQAGETDWFTGRVRLTPRNWVTLDAWYSNPLGDEEAWGQPPTHSVIRGAIRSQFLRVFPSGYFELKVAMSLESFGTSTLGHTGEGDPVVLPGATFGRFQLQFAFGPFTAYLDRQNILDSQAGWVPGIPTLRGANAFGIRWVFWN